MGECLSRNLTPEELVVFRRTSVNAPGGILLDEIEIPENERNRKKTDTKYLYAFIGSIIFLAPFLIYTLAYSDIDRFDGYDHCGNICGRQNAKYSDIPCSGQDERQNPLLKIDTNDGMFVFSGPNAECVDSCPSNYRRFQNRCIRSGGRDSLRHYNSFHRMRRSLDSAEATNDDVGSYLNENAGKLLLLSALAVALSLLMMFLMRIATAIVVWSILGGTMLLLGIATIVAWTQIPDKALAISFTIIFVGLLCALLFLFKKIQLVIQILKEATKAVIAMPMLCFIPVITFISHLIVLTLLGITTAFMLTSGKLQRVFDDYYDYLSDPVMIFTLVFNLLIGLWVFQFLLGIQYMTIAGAVCKWYFAKVKTNINSPILTSVRITFKYHLGSIAFGSLVITLMMVIRGLIRSLTRNRLGRYIFDTITKPIETFLKFLTKNSYIMTVLHGQPFYRSGKRAAQIILHNLVNVAAINYIGDFILVMAQLVIILANMAISFLIFGTDNLSSVAHVIVFFVTLTVVCTCFAVFETTIDTIFLCFCEDTLLNDGMARPYAMSRELMEFVESSKKIWKPKVQV